MKKLFCIGMLMTGLAAWGAAPATPWIFSVGAGAGYESGNGVHLGIGKGKNRGQLGLGLIYNDQNAEFQYSTGLRWLRTLYAGAINDTYAWIGAAVHGHYRSEEQGYLEAQGLGVGVSLHLGLPFHLNVDSGWDAFYDSERADVGLQWGPTINGSLNYEW